MDIIVRVKPSSSIDRVEEISEFEYAVRTTQPPDRGRANRAMIKLLAEHFGVAPSRITIVYGHTSKSKKVSIV